MTWRRDESGRTLLRGSAFLAALCLGPVLAAAEQVAPEPSRQAELRNLLLHDCGSCHGLTMKGGLGPALRPADLAGKADDALVEVILQGVPGTPMPPWGSQLARAEAQWLVRRLKEGDFDAP
jgi:cytochrome c55X